MNYFTDENGKIVVPLEYSGDVKEVRMRQPKGRDLKIIQQKAKEYAPYLDDITMVQITVEALSDGEVTIELMDELDALDMLALGEALGQFNFFRQMQARALKGT